MPNGLTVIISSPAGGGKDAVIRKLLEIFSNSTRIITTTSRLPRPNEQNGVNYFFITKEEFKKKIAEGYFLEYNDCAGNFYGTPKKYVEDLIKKYELVFTNIDVNGKHSFDKLGITNLSFFLLPESLEILRERAKRRGGMTDQMIDDRLRLSQEEIEKSKDFDHQIVNTDGKLEETVNQIADIIRKHQPNIATIDKKDKVS